MNPRRIFAHLFLLVALAAIFAAPAAQAQVFIVANCGTVPASQATLTAGKAGMFFIDPNGNLCMTAAALPLPPGAATAANQTADPCALAVKTNVPIATAAGNTQLVAGVASQKIYICSAHIIAAATAVLNLIEGTGAACTTANEAAVWGSTTAASGESYAANGGMTYGNGAGTVGATATAANGICLLQAGTVALAGNLTYVQR
jgi:hypothetical protein